MAKAKRAAKPKPPRWVAGDHALYVGDKLVRKFNRPAYAQEPVLAKFESEGWPPRVDNPFVGKVPNAKKKLHDAIKFLNLGQKAIRFRGTGDGLHVSWEWR